MKGGIIVFIISMFVLPLQVLYGKPDDIREQVLPGKQTFPEKILIPEKMAEGKMPVISRFLTPVIFEVNRHEIRDNQKLEDIICSIGMLANDTIPSLAYIWIAGSASPEGPSGWNMELGARRAEALKEYIRIRTGLPDSLFLTSNLGEDWKSFADIMEESEDFPDRERILASIYEEDRTEFRKQSIIEGAGQESWRRAIRDIFPELRNARIAIVTQYPLLRQIGMPAMKAEYGNRIPDTLITRPIFRPQQTQEYRKHWSMAVKTNLLYDAALTANLGIEISPWENWSLDIPVWYSPYSITPTRKIRLLAVQPEIRWWPGKWSEGHFIGLHTHIAGFNIAVSDKARYQDPNKALWGLGLGYGYAMRIGQEKKWGIEFNIGAGFARYSYDAYRNWPDGQKFTSGEGWYWGITRAGISLTYNWEFTRKDGKNR